MRKISCPVALLIMLALTACSSGGGNPLLKEWDTPFGVPPFDQIQDSDYLPAFRAAMAEQKAEIDAIANATAPATFANTLEALDRSGKTLTRVSNAFFPVE
jgi:peptidyl-dipeptidase Dcp